MNPGECKRSINYILESENINGEIYRCDIKCYFGWNLEKEKIDELHMVLTEIKNAKGHWAVEDRTATGGEVPE